MHRGPHGPSKRLGQNFLIERGIAEEIVSSVSPGQDDVVLEPGPGHGTLTRILVQKAGRVIAVEKDRRLASELRDVFRDHANLTVIEGDVLKLGEYMPSFNKLVSTPPYYISSKLTLFLANRMFDVAGIVFQKEFGQRLLAEPGTADYGRLTVMARRKLDVERVRDVSRTAFSPRPKVDSTLLRLTPKREVADLDEPLFEELVRGLFTQRRRLLKSAMAHFLKLKYGRTTAKELVDRLSIQDIRVYQLTISELESLSLQVWRIVSNKIVSGSLND